MKSQLLCSLAILSAFIGCSKFGELGSNDWDRFIAIQDGFDKGDFEYVLAECPKYLEDYPKSDEAWNVLGWAHLKFDEFPEAEECFDRALELNPKCDNAYVGKGSMYRKLGSNDKARASYAEAIKLVPDNAEAYTSLLVVELLEGNHQAAVDAGEKGWQYRKDYAVIPANLSIAYHFLGDFAKRDEFYAHAKRLQYYRMDTLDEIISGELTLSND
ncbi:MAG: tetratricopeptide repeat protein [Planctomycetota bacterium]